MVRTTKKDNRQNPIQFIIGVPTTQLFSVVNFLGLVQSETLSKESPPFLSPLPPTGIIEELEPLSRNVQWIFLHRGPLYGSEGV